MKKEREKKAHGQQESTKKEERQKGREKKEGETKKRKKEGEKKEGKGGRTTAEKRKIRRSKFAEGRSNRINPRSAKRENSRKQGSRINETMSRRNIFSVRKALKLIPHESLTRSDGIFGEEVELTRKGKFEYLGFTFALQLILNENRHEIIGDGIVREEEVVRGALYRVSVHFIVLLQDVGVVNHVYNVAWVLICFALLRILR